MKEIGGYFELDEFISNEYYTDLISLNNGRNALLYILKAKKIRKLYIPYLLCDSIRDMLIKYGYEFEQYNVDYDFMPIFNKKLLEDEYIDIVNYYGQITSEKVINLKHKYKNIILDNTHAFFQKPIENIDTIYSCRKFFGVPDGSYLSTDRIINENLETDISKERMIHILGRYEGKASEYYSFYSENDESYSKEELKYMSRLTHNILGAINYEKVRKVRNRNFSFLKNELGKFNKLKLIVPDGAFCYPLYVKDGEHSRKMLAKKKIYIPTLWPNVLDGMSKNTLEYQYVSNILPIPCDQRYSIEDMSKIINNLKRMNLLNNM